MGRRLTTGRAGKLFAPVAPTTAARRVTVNLFVELDRADDPVMVREALDAKLRAACAARGLELTTDRVALRVLRKLPADWQGGRPQPGETVVQARAWCRPRPPVPAPTPAPPTETDRLAVQLQASAERIARTPVPAARSWVGRLCDWVRAVFVEE